MTFRPLLLVALALMLANCSSTEQVAQRDSARCEASGLKPDSDGLKNCMVRLETERRLRMDARHQEMLERSANPLPR